jgi:hypothetical protein
MNAKMLVLMMVVMMSGCATAPPVELNGQAPPQRLVKGPSAVLIKKHIEFGPNGPVQACDYTVTLSERFTVYSDICLAYIPVPKEVIADIEAHPGQKPREDIKTVGKILPSNTWNTKNDVEVTPRKVVNDPPPKVYGTPIDKPIVHGSVADVQWNH